MYRAAEAAAASVSAPAAARAAAPAAARAAAPAAARGASSWAPVVSLDLAYVPQKTVGQYPPRDPRKK